MLPLGPTFSVVSVVTYYQTNFKSNINEPSQAKGTAFATVLFATLWLPSTLVFLAPTQRCGPPYPLS